MDLEDAGPGPGDARDNPGGFVKGWAVIMFVLGMAAAAWRLGNRFVARPVVGGVESLSNLAENTASENSGPTGDTEDVF
jgi:hypothetical protein